VYKEAIRQKILGVAYTHLTFEDGKGDLYVTDDGVPFLECLLPVNFWEDKDWFRKHSEKLSGTSSIYRIRTKTIRGRYKDIVLKWNRMGQDVPGNDDTEEFLNARFNSPFEEFSLVTELRESIQASRIRMCTHKPLAIYTPGKRVELWKTGRKEYRMQGIIEKHVDIALDMHRAYAVIYEWVKGLDAAEACRQGLIDEDQMKTFTIGAYEMMNRQGFDVKDRKPQHIILRPKNGSIVRDKNNEPLYALIDFELLLRTRQRDSVVKAQRRSEYLRKQRDRFSVPVADALPSHLSHVNIMGVDYIYGRCESTEGELWVVGKDPDLFEYFLPEKWEQTPRTRLSGYSEIYHTLTKDNINLVWKVSKVGIHPDADPFKQDERRIIEFGYNSPFEEISIAVKLSSRRIHTIYPRAIYMTGIMTGVPHSLRDDSRYTSHASYVNPDGNPILRDDRDYILIWGYWNGPDEKLADEDGNYYEGINALRALRDGIISRQKYIELLETAKKKLHDCEVEDLNLRGSHLLLSILTSTGHLITDSNNMPEVRICNFELLKEM
jgi:hypothetical protein